MLPSKVKSPFGAHVLRSLDLQVAELTSKLEGVPARAFEKVVRDVPSVVKAETSSAYSLRGEVIEVYRRQRLWKSSRAGGDDAEVLAVAKPNPRVFAKPAIWLVRVRSCPEELKRLDSRACTVSFVVAEDELLCTGYVTLEKPGTLASRALKLLESSK